MKNRSINKIVRAIGHERVCAMRANNNSFNASESDTINGQESAPTEVRCDTDSLRHFAVTKAPDDRRHHFTMEIEMHRLTMCAAALALSFTLSAQAGPLDRQKQVVVHYDDINVHQSAGARVLLSRLDAAANDVCGPAPSLRDLNGWQIFKSCTADTEARAIASLPFDLMARLDTKDASEVAAR